MIFIVISIYQSIHNVNTFYKVSSVKNVFENQFWYRLLQNSESTPLELESNCESMTGSANEPAVRRWSALSSRRSAVDCVPPLPHISPACSLAAVRQFCLCWVCRQVDRVPAMITVSVSSVIKQHLRVFVGFCVDI